MPSPIPILTLQGAEWMKGLSVQEGLPLGGIFSEAVKFDPFSLAGYLRGSLAAVDVDTTTLSTEIKAMASGASGADPYVFAIGNRGGTGEKCFYRILTTDNSVTDLSDSVATNVATGAVNLGGLAIYDGFIIYFEGNSGSVRRVVFPAATGDANILTCSSYSVANGPIVFKKGPDDRLYFGRGNLTGLIGVVYRDSGLSWQSNEGVFTINKDQIARDFANDGRYLVIIGDNNASKTSGAASMSTVYFWDTGAPTWNVAYDIPDSYLISVQYVNGHTYVFGASGIWEVGVGMAPQLIRPLVSTQLPMNPYQITNDKGILYWVAQSGSDVYAFGNLFGGKPTLYTPDSPHESTNLQKAIVSAGDYRYVALDGTGGATIKVVALNYGATRANATIVTVVQHLPQPYAFSHLKVSLGKALASGEAVAVQLLDGTTGAVFALSTKSYASVGAKKTLLFNTESISIKHFESFQVIVNSQGGAVIERATLYATPVDDSSQLV